MELIHIGAGCLVGLVIGLTGVGGGSLMTPILVMGFGYAPAIAVGTDLLYAAITKCSGVFFHHKNGTVDWKVVLLLGSGSVPCSLLTIALLERLRTHGVNYDHLIISTLGVMLVLTAVIIIIKNRLLEFIHRRHNRNPLVNLIRQQRPIITMLAGCLLGIVVTLSSVGAGAIGSAILFLMYPHKRPINVVGTDLAHAVPLTAIAGFGHMHFGSIDFNLLLGLLAGGLPAIYLGSLLGKKLPDRILRPVIATLLSLMGVKLLLTQDFVNDALQSCAHQTMQTLSSLASTLQQWQL
ncbi:sulfite exporter TauE/SafE family protein [Methylomarinum sp. Ch1-1]|uniref:Probable membrane transporter protein n=1 Tax=Methylomarinum roseum TaxID=3067653 RepID=A0AAU7NXK8_9GAMM